jgi:hypothetical protein
MTIRKRVLGALAAVALAATGMIGVIAEPAVSQSGGPVSILGIDAEDGGVGGHGPLASYTGALDAVLGQTSNGGDGLVVFGCTTAGADQVSAWWAALAASVGESLTCVEGAAAIGTQSLAGFQVIGVASDFLNTPSGGLTQAENDALASRSADIAAFVNEGGGLFGLSSTGFTNPYAYLGVLGTFTFNFPGEFDDITSTPEGEAVGITDALDICCWHDEYLTFPSFLSVLATNAATGNAVALGGADVVLEPPVVVRIPPGGGPMCADNRQAVRVHLVVKPRAGTSVVSVDDPVMNLTKVTKRPNAWFVHLKSTTGSSIPAHQATVVVEFEGNELEFVVDIPAFTCSPRV